MTQTHLDYNNQIRSQLTMLERLQTIPWPLFFIVACLGGAGVTMLYTVSQGSWDPLAIRHMQRLALMLPLGILMALVDVRVWFRLAYPVFLGSIVLLILVQFLGTEFNNAKRWIDLGFMLLQPSEIVQVALILALARYFHGLTHAEIGQPMKLVVPLLMIMVPFVLIFQQPDLGTSLKMLFIAAAIFFAAGVRWWKFALLAAVGIGLFSLGFERLVELGLLKGYHVERIMTLLDCQDIRDECYQIFNSVTAIGNGGLLGQGYGLGSQIQNDFLPEAESDFILAAIGEEFGFFGVMGLVVLKVLLLVMAMRIGVRSQSQFGRVLAIGIMFNFFLYLFINAGMIAGILPVVGMPLPLVSHGGTAMLVAIGMVGLLGSVAIHHMVPIERLAGERDLLNAR